jgi:chemotaxis protein MotA
MFIIIGAVAVIIGVVAGFTMAGGKIATLIQISEFITIGGATLGSLLIANPLSTIKKIIGSLTKALSPPHYHKHDYLELLKSFNDLFLVAQRDGLLAIEKHIESPGESEILKQCKKFINNEFQKNFFCDTMKVLLTGGIPPHELEAIIDTEIETFDMEVKPIGHALNRVGDALPGLGIVAAVLGIIVTMGSINEGAETVGHHVASALVGTFLGVLMSYGFIGPLAANIEHVYEGETRVLQTIKACIVAYAKGNPPIIAVEIARRTIFTDDRPTFKELENYVRGKRD